MTPSHSEIQDTTHDITNEIAKRKSHKTGKNVYVQMENDAMAYGW